MSLLLTLICLITFTYSICDNYFQDPDVFGPKTPFNECVSKVNRTEKSSYQYICVDSASNNSISGYDVIRQDFNDTTCNGAYTETMLSEPFDVECGSICDIMKVKHYPSITNTILCTYDNNIYYESNNVVGECANTYFGLFSTETFCPLKKNSNSTNILPYYWHNQYYGMGCVANQISRTLYTYNGCQSSTHAEYIELVRCDDESNELLSLNLSKSIIPNSGNNYQHVCNNYWLSHDASSRIRPFDICYESYANSVTGNWSFKYVCEYGTDHGENYTINGYTVMAYHYNNIDCVGDINRTELGDINPYEINCGDVNCPYVRWREYEEISPQVCDYKNYKEKIHAISMCDDDGHTSDTYFCTNDYFYINAYHNDKCINDGDIYNTNSNGVNGLYLSQYFYNGCNGLPVTDYEIIECIPKPYTKHPTYAPTDMPTVVTIPLISTTDDDVGAAVVNPYKHSTFIFVLIYWSISYFVVN